jgi:hypothetical protein
MEAWYLYNPELTPTLKMLTIRCHGRVFVYLSGKLLQPKEKYYGLKYCKILREKQGL